jgi:maltose alpha-D-glucosyltransferase/alpha-amylase
MWHAQAAVYQVAPEQFAGDLAGLTARLAYVRELGFDTVWVLPFFASPRRDFGYDVVDHCAVDPRFGSEADFAALRGEAERLGLRLVVDLIASHTSSDHPWFQAARADPGSRYRDYYLWSEEPQGGETAFPGEEEGPWSYDEVAGLWYCHRFYRHEPDLDNANPAVRDEVAAIVRHWCGRGVDGLRIDAASVIAEKAGVECFAELRATLAEDAILIAEADVDASEQGAYFGDGERVHLLLNFYLTNCIFLALAREQAEPIVRGLEALPVPPAGCGWANFLRNHDELDLGQLTGEQREDVFRAFAPDEGMRLYGRGIRRRLAPMLGGERRRIELAHSVLVALPGIPVLPYGDELGLGDDLSLPGRDAVRVPMAWAEAEAQLADEGSLLHAIRRLVGLRRELPVIGTGRCEAFDAGAPEVLALRYEGLRTLHNLSGRAVELRGAGLPERLEPYGYRFLR